MENIKNVHIPEGVSRFLRVLLISLLPGVCISLILFVNAIYHDIQQQIYRNSLPDTDLSLVRIEDRTISDNEPYISMIYPMKSTFGKDEGGDNETWHHLTVDGVPIPDYETMLDTLNGTNNWLQGTRPLNPYSVFLDRSNDIELRFCYGYMGEVNCVEMMRIDNRGVLAFLTQRKLLSYNAKGLPFGWGAGTAYGDALTDSGHVYGPRLFWHWEPNGIIDHILNILRSDGFLFYLREYFYIPLYGAMWIYPLAWAINKRRVRWFLPLIIWYPSWYVVCLISYLAQQ